MILNSLALLVFSSLPCWCQGFISTSPSLLLTCENANLLVPYLEMNLVIFFYIITEVVNSPSLKNKKITFALDIEQRGQNSRWLF